MHKSNVKKYNFFIVLYLNLDNYRVLDDPDDLETEPPEELLDPLLDLPEDPEDRE